MRGEASNTLAMVKAGSTPAASSMTQARQGKALLGWARLGEARTGGAGQCSARQSKALRFHMNHTHHTQSEESKTMAKTAAAVAEAPTKKSMVEINKFTDTIKRKVTLVGLTDVMFDRYAGDNDTKLEPNQKLYLLPGALPVIGLPAVNLMSFLSAHNTNSAPKRLRDKRKYKDICNACLSFVQIGPGFIPFTRDGEPILFGKFEHDVDKQSGVYVHRSVARLDKGIPNPKVRPVLPLPWSITFDFTLFPNREIKEQEILNLFEEGGRALGLGTFRGVFGKFAVESWE
jgi:hypothetical protein